MIPVSDVIPTRTAPVVTVALMPFTVLLATSYLSAPLPYMLAAMPFLWLFGWTVEDRLGHGRLVLLYVACGASALLVADRSSAATGAVSGVLGAYFALYPRSWMLVLVPVPMRLVEVPATVFLGLWWLLQFVAGALVGQLAGFVTGAVLSFAIRRPERTRVDWWAPYPRDAKEREISTLHGITNKPTTSI